MNRLPPAPRRRLSYRSKSLISLGIALAFWLILIGVQLSDYLSHPGPDQGRKVCGLVIAAVGIGAMLYLTLQIPRPRPSHCSFCGQAEPEVGPLIAGPGVYICERCVGTCQTILDRRPPKAG